MVSLEWGRGPVPPPPPHLPKPLSARQLCTLGLHKQQGNSGDLDSISGPHKQQAGEEGLLPWVPSSPGGGGGAARDLLYPGSTRNSKGVLGPYSTVGRPEIARGRWGPTLPWVDQE